MFKQFGNLASLLKSAQEMGGKMQEITDRLKSKRVTGSAGGGMVTVEANGVGEILSVRLDPTLVEKGEFEMVEDLLPPAVNDAITKANELRAAQMQTLTEGLDVPGLQDALNKFQDLG
jgi:DNA-binding YbaB/EbfC family protein